MKIYTVVGANNNGEVVNVLRTYKQIKKAEKLLSQCAKADLSCQTSSRGEAFLVSHFKIVESNIPWVGDV